MLGPAGGTKPVGPAGGTKPEKEKRSGQLAYRIDPRTRYVSLPAGIASPLYEEQGAGPD